MYAGYDSQSLNTTKIAGFSVFSAAEQYGFLFHVLCSNDIVANNDICLKKFFATSGVPVAIFKFPGEVYA